MFCIYIVHSILYIYIVYCVCIFYILYISVYSASAFSEISTFSHIYTHICRCRMYTYIHIYIKCRYLQPIPFPVTFPQLEAKLAGKAMCQAKEICVRQKRSTSLWSGKRDLLAYAFGKCLWGGEIVCTSIFYIYVYVWFIPRKGGRGNWKMSLEVR